MLTCELKIAHFQDLHLGHSNTDTEFMINGLNNSLPDNSETAKLDMIVFAGDVFDHLLHLPAEEVYHIRMWILHVLQIAKKYDIVVRVLEGTPGHDWKQSRLFTHLNKLAEINADVKYVSILDIEHIERFGIDVLYIPDEWRPTCEQTWNEVKDKLRERGLEKVDFTIMHGAFPHQLPKNTHDRLELHNPDNYLSITRYFVMVGHVHIYSQYEWIMCAGSHDRVSQGEESPKGHLRYVVRPSGVHDIRFIENKLAKIYRTVKCGGLTEEEVMALVETKVKNVPPSSYIRIQCKKKDVALSLLPAMEAKWPHLRWSKPKISDANVISSGSVLTDNRAKLPTMTLNPDNIKTMLLGRIRDKHPSAYGRCALLLEAQLNE